MSCSSDAMALSKLLNKDAKSLRDLAEEFFMQQKIPLAICAIESAKHHDPKLPGVQSYSDAYIVHHLAAKTKSWYGVLGIEDHGAGIHKIKKHYKGRLEQLFRPEKCSSVAAESAIELVNEAWEVLSDAKRREAYDMLMGYKHVLSSKKQTSETQLSSTRSRNPSPASSSSSSPSIYHCHSSKKRKQPSK